MKDVLFIIQQATIFIRSLFCVVKKQSPLLDGRGLVYRVDDRARTGDPQNHNLML